MHRLDIFKNKKVLLLQGPVGTFFKRFSNLLEKEYAAKTYKINFCGGDYFFYPDGINFSGGFNEFEHLLESLIFKEKIDYIVFFGDCRFFHSLARKIAKKNKVKTISFEEGYIRPFYITMEEDGVNGYSSILKKEVYELKDVYKKESFLNSNQPSQTKIAFTLYLYNFMSFIFKFKFQEYVHHRNFGIREGFLFSKAWIRRRLEKKDDERIFELFKKEKNNKFFIPMQVSTDSQVLCHSQYKDIEDFLYYIFVSFDKTNAKLLFKDHPLEIEHDYKKIILRIANEIGNENVFFIRTGHIHEINEVVDGVITINSTVGLQSLRDGKPVFALGSAIYAKKGLAENNDLKGFIKNPKKFEPNKNKVKYFKEYLRNNTQLQGSFY